MSPLGFRTVNHVHKRKSIGPDPRSGTEGLALLHKCIERVANHRDWDALSRFYVSARKFGQGQRVADIIRAAFGQKISFRLNARHATGGTFSLKWDGQYDLERSNTYAVIRDAVARGISWDDKDFGRLLPKQEKGKRIISDEAIQKTVNYLVRYLSNLDRDGFPIGEIISQTQKELALRRTNEMAHKKENSINLSVNL